MVEIQNGAEFASDVMGSQGKVLVEFYATWCPHCQREQPIIDELAAKLDGQVPVYQIDVDKLPSLAGVYAPKGFPTYVLFEDGAAVRNLSGERPLEELEQLVAA